MLKKLLIPHSGNDYKPHLLHHKRVWFYGSFLAILKVIIVITILLLPEQAWLSSDAVVRQGDQIVALTNEIRANKDLPALTINALLNKSATTKAEDMGINNYFDHTDEQGRGLAYYLRLTNYKYTFAGENLALGYIDANAVMRAWKNSPTHYANLVDTDFKEMGVGITAGNYNGRATAFMVSHFGTPSANAAENGIISAVAGIKIPGQSQIAGIYDKYLSAKLTFSDWFYGEFEFSNYIYYIFLGFFALALITTIIIEKKRRHPHLIINGLGMMLFIIFLIKI